MNHPCNNSSCCEYNQGQCFGGGCRLNPLDGVDDEDYWREVSRPCAEHDEEDDSEDEED